MPTIIGTKQECVYVVIQRFLVSQVVLKFKGGQIMKEYTLPQNYLLWYFCYSLNLSYNISKKDIYTYPRPFSLQITIHKTCLSVLHLALVCNLSIAMRKRFFFTAEVLQIRIISPRIRISMIIQSWINTWITINVTAVSGILLFWICWFQSRISPDPYFFFSSGSK